MLHNPPASSRRFMKHIMCCQIGFSGRMRVFGGLMHAKTYETRKKQEARGDCSRIERTLMEAGENSCDTLHYPPASTRRLMKRITCHQNGQKSDPHHNGCGSHATLKLHHSSALRYERSMCCQIHAIFVAGHKKRPEHRAKSSHATLTFNVR